MYAVCLIGSVDWKLLWDCERETNDKAKRKMKAENKLLILDKYIKYYFPFLGIS